jgi:predicted nucleic acid-binding protein
MLVFDANILIRAVLSRRVRELLERYAADNTSRLIEKYVRMFLRRLCR